MSGVLLSALLLVLAYPPCDFGILGLVALIPWLRALETLAGDDSPHPLRAAWWSGYGLGVLYFGGTMWWLGHVTITGTVVLVAYLALYPAAFGALVVWALRRRVAEGLPLAAFLASGWTLLEWVRSTFGTGLGWNLLAHTQWRGPFLQLADLVGVYGVSWLVALLNVAIWQAWRRRGRSATVIILLVFAAVGYAAVRRAVVERALVAHPVLPVAVVQGNIPQEQKWDSDYVATIADRYEALTRQAAAAGAKLIVWPETSVPGYANESEWRDWLADRSEEVEVPLLVGAPWLEEHPGPRLFNSALLVTPVEGIVERYDKLHLVPFGEFLPGERWWPVLGRVRERLPIGQFTPGTHPTIFQIPTDPPVAAGVLICFEDVFPDISRLMVRRGARLLATITNDAWFGQTAAPIQHTQASVFRAVEHRVWMLRAANTGYSCVIDPLGRVVAAVHDPAGRALGVPGVQVVPMPVGSAAPTPYTRFGDGWLLLCAATVALTVTRLR